ncbi:chloride channel protein CLC-e isoform X3 [Citrus clementina]|uniref:chloride channel protein CLC-e isoform X3 n=1 Tax=Citrus clementina TaxID=85681 RepID=UPI000CED5BFE|nr:chloride channel protein CLC-e isoform X3 [Citrus x clementina]
MECKLQLLLWQEHLQWHCCSSSSRVIPSSYQCKKSEPSCFKLKQKKYLSFSNSTKSLRLRPLGALPENERNRKEQPMIIGIDGHEVGNSGVIISSCLVGLLTGIGVVLFNKGVHEIRDFFWDEIPYGGASWLREKPIPAIWIRVVLVPACGGFIVSILNQLRYALSLDDDDDDDVQQVQDKSYPPPHPQAQAKDDISVITVSSTTSLPTIYYDYLKIAFQPLLKAVAACITLGTGNSLGPEGPSVEIGKSIAKGVGNLFDRRPRRKVSLVAAGSAAGISSGFNAAVAGCFFAVESVIWPSSAADSSASLAYTTSMVILSAVIASVVSEVGLGSEPAFKVPEYDFRSPGELPLYLLLGVLCGLISLTLSRCTTYMLAIVDNLQKDNGIPKAVFPVMGGLAVGLIALMFPEILYWGFENVDILLESRPFVKGLSADMLLQLVAAKIVATSLCRASGLVGGYYAPSLFIGAATGMAYGKFINFAIAQSNPTIHFSILEVASPQAYGLVGMAATLAGVCQVPLTSVLLLFELTQDYRIVLPLLGAVGLSSWFTSGQMRRRDVKETKVAVHANTNRKRQFEIYTSRTRGLSSSDLLAEEEPYAINLCEVESSLCIDDWNLEVEELKRRVFVSEVMRTRIQQICTSKNK